LDQEKNEKAKRGARPSKVWVPAVITLGALIGAVSYYVASQTAQFPRFGGPFGPDAYLEFHIIFSTIGMALLVALILVYARTYQQTRANFILGLLVVLFALLLQSLLTYPLLLELELTPRFAFAVFSPVADVFTIIAYAVFLYLSLE
jgi:hypothetical protein